MKRLALLTIPSLVLLAGGVGSETIERVVAKVNGDIVTLSEFTARQVAAAQVARISSDQVPAFLRENNARILQEAIDELLVIQRADELGVEIRSEYIESVIEEIKQENNLESDEQLRAQLRQEGMSLSDLRRNIKRSILRRQVLSYDLEAKTTVSEEEIVSEYEAKRATEYSRPPTVRLQEIVVGGEGGRELAEELIARARAGEDFAALARAYSTGPSREAGGDLGRLERGDLNPAIETVAFSLEVGAISDPIELGEEIRVLRVAERTEASVVSYEEVKDEIRDRLAGERRGAAYTSYVEGLRENAVINIRVREVPLEVSLPEGPTVGAAAASAQPAPEPAGTETPVQNPFAGAGLPDLSDELSISPQAAPEKVAPPTLSGTQPAPPEPEPTPTPSPQ